MNLSETLKSVDLAKFLDRSSSLPEYLAYFVAKLGQFLYGYDIQKMYEVAASLEEDPEFTYLIAEALVKDHSRQDELTKRFMEAIESVDSVDSYQMLLVALSNILQDLTQLIKERL